MKMARKKAEMLEEKDDIIDVIDESEHAEKHEKRTKKVDINELIEKGKKKGSLSTEELDYVIEELDYDMESLDKLYETLEDNGITLNSEMSSSDISKIESEVESFSASENMDWTLDGEWQKGAASIKIENIHNAIKVISNPNPQHTAQRPAIR